MQRALGEGPEALALMLAAVWLSAIVALPLEHAVLHASDDAGHCHDDGGALVCHGQERDDGAAVRDGSLPVLGDLALAHGAVAVLSTPPLTVLPAVTTTSSVVLPAALTSRFGAEHGGIANARGPPGCTLVG